MSNKLESQLNELTHPSPEEKTGLDLRHRKTSILLNRFVANTLDGAFHNRLILEEYKNYKKSKPESFDLLPTELADFLRAFRPQATSMSYRLEFCEVFAFPKLAIIVARGMEDVAWVEVFNKKREISVEITNNWRDTHPEIDNPQKKLERVLFPEDPYQRRVNQLAVGQKILGFAIQRVQQQGR